MYKFIFIVTFYLINFSVFSQQVALTLETTKGNETQYVDAGITELSYVKNYITRIEGLDQLKQLQSIILDKTAFIEDYSFLRDAHGLRKLVIVGVASEIDLSFIKYLPDLEMIVIFGNIGKGVKLDLSYNSRLEYLAFCNGSLESFPEILNVPPTLRYLNLINNKIRFLPANYRDYENVKILLRNNLYEGEKSNNITFDWAEDVLERKYLP
jgi:Leucine-rich repeat (LRR) protein